MTGDFPPLPGPDSYPLSRSGDTWSTTLGPFPPDLYSYGFIVDGIELEWHPFEVRSDHPEFYDFRPVPHGALHVLTYNSKVLNETRRVQVYTPPDYATGAQQLPVLYLLHPAGHAERAWTDNGEVPNILDNLIADGRARPMIVVMPFAYPIPALRSREEPPDNPRDDRRFESDLLNEILPLTERTFRTPRQPDGRAIAGASMGAVQALTFGLAHLDKSHIGLRLSAASVDCAARATTPDLKNSSRRSPRPRK